MTPEQAQRAIYIDFEGRKDRPPVVLGYTEVVEGDPTRASIQQVVVHPLFNSVADATHLSSASLATALAALSELAERSDRYLVAYSRHELDIAADSLRDIPDALDRFERRYVNALRLARYWRSQLHRDWDFPREKYGGTYRLSRFVGHAGYRVPSMAGPGNTGSRLADIETALTKGITYDRWRGTRKAKWTNLLRHNVHDILGMRFICVKAANELAER